MVTYPSAGDGTRPTPRTERSATALRANRCARFGSFVRSRSSHEIVGRAITSTRRTPGCVVSGTGRVVVVTAVE
jgi:hypothetical protein